MLNSLYILTADVMKKINMCYRIVWIFKFDGCKRLKRQCKHSTMWDDPIRCGKNCLVIPDRITRLDSIILQGKCPSREGDLDEEPYNRFIIRLGSLGYNTKAFERECKEGDIENVLNHLQKECNEGAESERVSPGYRFMCNLKKCIKPLCHS